MRNFYSSLILLILFGWVNFYSVLSTAQECNIIYIVPSGASSGTAGTIANPANLTYALTALVSSTNNQLWLATGTYPISNTLLIPDNATIEGGFNSATWTKSNVAQSIIDRDANNIVVNPANALIGLAGNSVSNFRLQDITVNVANAPGNQVSVYGIYLSQCSNYSITRCTVTTGSGSPGLAGVQGTTGTPGGNGSPGNPGNPNENSQPGGVGGVGGGGASNGGNGAPSGKWNGSIGPGSPGLPGGCGGVGGNTGSGPSCGFLGCGNCSDASPGSVGSNGQAGISGSPGSIGPAGSVVLGYFVPGPAGFAGAVGTAGCGGGGGGGGGGDQQSGPDGVGGSGGGGGGGGDGGLSGAGGTGGGSSFAVFLFSNGLGGIIQDCLLNPGAAGLGGVGGTGGNGGTGGIGGAGGIGDCPQENGAAGGNGGIGGNGGNGGDGSPGISIALSETGGTPVSNLGINSVPGNPPDITVFNKGCTNSEVIFTATTSGTWNFGAGSTPSSATGTGPFSVYYSSLGRKTIVFNGTTFTGYVNIFQSSPTLPTISPANAALTVGCPNTFTTSLTGSYYEWIFGSSASPDTVQGSTMQTVSNVYFGAPGTFTIYVYVTTACCGRVLDSTTVTVTQSNFNVTLTSAPPSACQGSAITFTANPTTYLGYEFFVNDVAVQNGTGNTYTTSALQPGDSVVVIALSGTCFTNPSMTVYPVIKPIPLVTLTSSASPSDSICAGTDVIFTAAPGGYSNYEFFDGGTSLQNGTGSTFITTALVPGNSITVIATDAGCPSLASNAIVTIVSLLPVVTLTSSDANDQICVGDNITFTGSPAGLTNYEFFDGGTSLQSGPGNTYSTSSLASGNSITIVATSTEGCIGAPSNVIITGVNPIPTATLSSSDSDGIICQNESIIFTSTPSGYVTYDFYNGATQVQSGSSNTFTTNALAPGNSITVIASNSGCSSPASNDITISIIPAPVVEAGTAFQACVYANAISLTGFSPTGGIWTGSGITSPSGVFDPATAGVGSHQLLYAVTNSSNCTGYDTLIATINPKPIVAAHSASICSGQSANLTAGGADTYIWSPATGLSSTTGSNVTANPVVNTTYTLIGTSLAGCADTTNVIVTVNELPTVTISGNTSINACESTVLSANPTVGTFKWTPNSNIDCTTCPEVTVAPLITQDYYLSYADTNGCVDTDTITVTVTEIYTYFMPTGLSPNGDGMNDVIQVHGRGIQSINLKIFDRIGEKVFETNDVEKAWDGKLHGVGMNDNVFVYMLEVDFCNGEVKKEKGNITLVK